MSADDCDPEDPPSPWTQSIRYINTDLVICSSRDLTPLSVAFEAAGVWVMHTTLGNDGRWWASMEVDKNEDNFQSADENIQEFMRIVELLPPHIRVMWDQCDQRVLDIGYDCGIRPWAFTQRLELETLQRVVSARCEIKWTLYPPARIED